MSFQKNEVIVRDDGKYPDGALIVDGYDASGALLAHPFGGGFQLIIPIPEHDRFSPVGDAERTPIFMRTIFALEGRDGSFAGWTDGRNWNGWAMPRFEFTEAQRVIAALGSDVGRYDQTADAFITETEAGEPESWAAQIIHLPDGGTVKVYPIGTGSWIWEQEDSA